MKTISTARLMLGEANVIPNPEELSQMVMWLKNPDVIQYSEQRHRAHDLRSQWNYMKSFVWPSQIRMIRWGDELIGTITAHVDSPNSVADMGIMIGDTQVWGENFGTEAWVALMKHLFDMGVRKIEAGCMDLNRAMVGIFRNSGMKKEGIRENHFISSHSEGGYMTCNLEQWGKFKNG